ncbi:PUA-like domain-containing protein [Cercophora samala]|uniref:PUA-like domain-containing protein n=1 Tax=Cercophora samala TaxID=330535 RepID=A0AA39ZJK5_9PEZI|nr:PUA-like domain-containing protein [Cercophora samala]
MPILSDDREPRGSSRGSHGNPRRSNRRPGLLNAGVSSRRRVIPPMRSPQMRVNLLAAAQNVQAAAQNVQASTADSEDVRMEAPAAENTTAQASMAEVSDVTSNAPEHNAASDPPSVGGTSDPDPATQPIQIWTGSLSEGVRQVTMLVTKSKPGRTDVSTAQLTLYQESTRAFFWWLEFDAVVRPSFRDVHHLDHAIRLIRDSTNPGIPADIKQAANTVYLKFEEENWGQGDEGYASDISTDAAQSPVVSPRSPGRASGGDRAVGVSVIPQPPVNHPIYGRAGIMHGIVCYRSRKGLTYKLNPGYRHEKVNAAFIGEGHLTPGDWWPLQLVALFHGAHGRSQGGIYGSVTMGVYSIVISGRSNKYHEIDEDDGEVLHYSTDNMGVATTSVGTQALDKSIETRQPVRVLRGQGQTGGNWAPEFGIRYDGLYQVTGKRLVSTRNGEEWFRYTLRRQAGQRDLREIVGSSPTLQQKNDYRRIRDAYPGVI